MDTLRDQFSSLGDQKGNVVDRESAVASPETGKTSNDERRMQVRAYNFWASLLGQRNFPLIADLKPEQLPDFGPRSVLLDLTAPVGEQGIADGNVSDPAIVYLGWMLAQECGAEGTLQRLGDVPSGSLLSCITDEYKQIITSQAPTGFEAEFVNHAGVTFLYRSILLPFSGDGEQIDFVYGVINWKECTEPRRAVITPSAETYDTRPAMLRSPQMATEPLTGWADGPADFAIDLDLPAIDTYFPIELPQPGFAMEAEPSSFEQPSLDLAGWLASARELAVLARRNEERSHRALYNAIGRAYDFALASFDAPEDFAALVEEAGLTSQARAPLMPLVKLVFGADYDKTRLTEFATAISHGRRMGMAGGTLGEHLDATPGGLKAVVREERRLRRQENAKTKAPTRLSEQLRHDLRARKATPLATVACDGEEFTLLIARRLESGEVVLVGEVSGDDGLLDRAARKLMG